MRAKIILFSFILSFLAGSLTTSCDELDIDLGLTEEEVAEGLKEALKVGTNNSVTLANALNGYYLHEIIKIPFPSEATRAKNYLISIGMESLVEDFVLELNRAAEHAAEKAKPIFIEAITTITIEDAWDILHGEDNAATMYLHDKTYLLLFTEFAPSITSSLEHVGASQTWATLADIYNSFANYSPIHEPVDTDIGNYTTGRALDGLFFLIEEEEFKIRTDASARISEILQRVFGELD